MKILVVTHENDLSGANKSLLGIIENLYKKVEFEIVLNTENGGLSETLQKMNIKTYVCKYAWWYAHTRTDPLKKIYRRLVDGMNYYSNRKPTKSFLNQIINNNYDLVYSNTGAIDFGALLAIQLNLPHIWHIREFGREDFGFQTLCSSYYYQTIYNQACRIIAISNAIKCKYEKFVPSEKIRVVYNGFDVEKLQAQIHEHNLRDITKVLIVGQVCAAKCQDQAIKACNLLVKKGYKIELHLAGDIDRDYLYKTIPNIDSLNWVKLHGMINNIYDLRSQIDIELVCSRNEAFGRVTIEAMLHGIPVVASNTGGTIELIQNNINGLLYNFGDCNDLAQKVEMLIRDKELYMGVAKKGQEYAINFTIGKTSEGVYEEFLNVSNSHK